jgi:hypothetical protein
VHRMHEPYQQGVRARLHTGPFTYEALFAWVVINGRTTAVCTSCDASLNQSKRSSGHVKLIGGRYYWFHFHCVRQGFTRTERKTAVKNSTKHGPRHVWVWIWVLVRTRRTVVHVTCQLRPTRRALTNHFPEISQSGARCGSLSFYHTESGEWGVPHSTAQDNIPIFFGRGGQLCTFLHLRRTWWSEPKYDKEVELLNSDHLC